MANKAASKTHNPWEGLLSYLRERTNPAPAPRKLSDWQLYMIKKPLDVASVFEAEWPTLGRPDKDKLAVRTEISKRLLRAETETYRRELRDEVEQLHAQALEAYAEEVRLCAPSEADTQELYVRDRPFFVSCTEYLL